ncbi:unnamed protein product [Kluyveromyces dobzhanskii CBS 2104]|uniref:WGS project CCBQ000000000 data, contig 00058 n=1 Tax=Kluyveromyces dobzhanskii CBS 2104 TaxID=1427455 RepID=A0A0A8LDW3_9SACH|nr:unnamed protein product [Kluyveromyces dobzhanskii CBS 2104]
MTEEIRVPRTTRNPRKHVRYKFQFTRDLRFQDTNYKTVTSMDYLSTNYGQRTARIIHSFISCIHRKISHDVSKISDDVVVKVIRPIDKLKLFLLLVTLSQRGGPDYWLDKHGKPNSVDYEEEAELKNFKRKPKLFCTLLENVMRENIKKNFDETLYDENYVYSSIWANFMEGLINHYLERVIIPKSERKVCQQLYKPMMKIISLYNEYNDLIEKSENSGLMLNSKSTTENESAENKLANAQKLLWKARQDIPKTISKELTLLSEMYSTLSVEEQDYQLDQFVCCAEEYIELVYLPSLIDVLFANCGSIDFWKIMFVLEPFFYYIEDLPDEGSGDETEVSDPADEQEKEPSKPDPRVATLEKICEVAAKENWI